jgi:hypothetical protein
VRDHSRTNRKTVRNGLLLAALALFGLLPATAASAVVVHVAGHAVSLDPGALSPPAGGHGAAAKGSGKGGNSGQLVYHGGPVMPANTNYTLFWAPGGSAAYPAGYQAGIDGFFENLAADSGLLSNSDSILTQYTDGTGHSAAYDSHFGAELIDTDPYPTSGNCTAASTCLTDAQIRAELVDYVQSHGLPIDLEHEYFVLTPEGVEDCMEQAGEDCSYGTKTHNYCAYHSYVEVLGADLIYAVNPLIPACDVEGHEAKDWPNENVSDAVIAGGLAHEHSESVTDPLGNAWWFEGLEVADKCQTHKASKKSSEFGTPLGTAPDGAPYNELINGHEYLYQEMWSNSAGACRQRAAELPVVTSISPKVGPAAGGTSVTISGSGFAEPATVHFGEAAATGVDVESSSTLTAVTPAGSGGKVAVTVTTEAGTSPESKKAAFKYKS